MEPSAAPQAGASCARAEERYEFARKRMPPEGLFAGHSWRFSPDPFPLSPGLARQLEELGRILLKFLRASHRLYRKSVAGEMPGWVARLLDQGKPDSLVALQRHPAFRQQIPRVIRPDILLTSQGLAITELDSVPGGIGLIGWLNQVYGLLAESEGAGPPLGGPSGPVEGFRGIFGEASRIHLMVSDEAAAYRPEMRWMADQLSARTPCEVRDGAFGSPGDGEAVYRFFELFDLGQVPGSGPILEAARSRRIDLTPPPCPLFEEKLLFSLFWNRNLRDYWRRELGGGFLRRLQSCIPYTWTLDPQPLPPDAAYPGLELTDWRQLAGLSQKERSLILKISGFSPQAWGARGVHWGSDLPAGEWGRVVERALESFPRNPHVLQRFARPETRPIRWYDPDRGTLEEMEGRTRLCPFYFVHGKGDMAKAHLGGCLATVCPPDKHIVHGMSQAVMSACAVAP